MNRKRLLGWLVIAGAAAAAVSFAPTSSSPEPEAAKVPSRQSDEPSAPGRLAALEVLKDAGGAR